MLERIKTMLIETAVRSRSSNSANLFQSRHRTVQQHSQGQRLSRRCPDQSNPHHRRTAGRW